MKISAINRVIYRASFLWLLPASNCLYAGAQQASTPAVVHAGDEVVKPVESQQGKLIGSVTMTELAAPKGIEWDESVLPKLRNRFQLTGQTDAQPEGLWYRVPKWAAGTWIASQDNANKFSSKPVTKTIGSLQDANGDIWQYSGGFVTARPWDELKPGDCEVINLIGGDIPMEVTADSYEIWNRNISITQTLKDHRTVRALISRTSQKYVLQNDGTIKQICNMTHLINQNFEGVEPTTDWSVTFKRTGPFKENASPEMVAGFHEYLKAHGMAELIPQQPASRASNLPPVQYLFAK